MRLVLLLLVLLQPFDSARGQQGKDKFLDAIEASDLGAVRNHLSTVQSAAGDQAARMMLLGLQKSRDRLKLLDRSMTEAQRALESANAHQSSTEADRRDKARLVESAQARVSQISRKWAESEEIHEVLRFGFGSLRSDEAFGIVSHELESESMARRIEAADALGNMSQPDAENRLVGRLAKEEAPTVLAAMLEALATKGTLAEESIGVVGERLFHRAWQVQVLASKALLSCGSKGSVGLLVAAHKKTDGRVRLEIDAALRKLTKMDLHGNPDAWDEWWRNNREDFLAGRHDPKNPKREPGPSNTFFEIAVTSKRIAFVIDRSRSMKEKLPDGRRKIDVVKTELKALLAALPDGVRINLLLFNEKVEAFSQSTRELDRQSRKDAAAFLDGLEPDGITDLWGALDRSMALAGNLETGLLREEGIDTIYVLSDGAPTCGRVVDVDLLVRAFSRLNRMMRLSVNTIAVGDAQKVLARLADLNDGKSVTK